MDVDYRLNKNSRRRVHHALIGKLKSISTRETLGSDFDTYKKWIENQMTPEINWSNIEIDHMKPIFMFDISKYEELRETFCWKITQPILKEIHSHKGIKFNFLDYQLQFIRGYQFLKSIEEAITENHHE